MKIAAPGKIFDPGRLRVLASAGARRRSSPKNLRALLDWACRLHDLHRSLVPRACVSSRLARR